MVGKTLGPYKILERLGAGGMGEVYRGEDTRLGRQVAIKVLPAEFASDPQRLARFGQEARAAAALNHPHIAVVHDVGSEPGDDGATTHFIVQEYLQGQSLRERLDTGALPLDKALDVAIEVGEALIAAHQAAIVHRDLKPGNIFLSDEGHAKVLDFGLAKLTEGAAPAVSSASMSPTMLGTVAGQVLGTAGYMAPEQVQGGAEIDRRADLFAFGCVLYETIAGKRAFGGETVLDTLHAIARDEPQPLGEIRPDLPAEFHRILKKCLAKEAARRYQIADELVVDLRQLRDDIAAGAAAPLAAVAAPISTEAGVPPGGAQKTHATAMPLVVPVAAAALVVGALVTWWATRPGPPDPGYPIRLELIIAEDLFPGIGSSIALSPDGTRIAYVEGTASGGGGRELLIRSLDQQDSTSLVAQASSSDAPYTPFFSPDGQWVGFVTATALKRVPVTGGTAVSIAVIDRSRGADWGPDGTIVVAPSPTSGLLLVPANGGEPEALTELAAGEATHRWPQFLPGGRAVLFTSAPSLVGPFAAAAIEVVDIATRERKVVRRGGSFGRYVASGHLVYASGGTLFAAPFDLETLETTGAAASVVETITTDANGAAQFSSSQNGTLVYRKGGPPGTDRRRLVWVDRDGNTEPLPIEPGPFLGGSQLSPDGRSLAVAVRRRDGQTDVYVYDVEHGTGRRLTLEGTDLYPVWSPDGQYVYYTSDSQGDFDIYRIRADGSSEEAESVLGGDGAQAPESVSPDDSRLLYAELAVGASLPDTWLVPLTGDSTPEPLLVASEFAEYRGEFSPDGKLIAYESNRGGAFQVFAREAATGRPTTVSVQGGRNPFWSYNGEELYFLQGRTLMAAAVATSGGRVGVGTPMPLFDLAPSMPSPADEDLSFFDAAEDGRFLMLAGAQDTVRGPQATTPHINVVLNWFEELKRRVPTGR